MNKIFYKKSLWGGIFFIAMGVILLLKNLNIITLDIPPYVFTWKMLLVAIGVVYLFSKSWFFGLMLISVGTFFLLPEAFGIPNSDITLFWPAILILTGILFISKVFSPKKKRISIHKPDNDYMESTVIFGGDTKKVSSYNFKGGKLTAICGGMEIDLTNCALSKEQNILDVYLFMGGVSIKVPKEWNIRIEVTNIMGGIEDNTSDRYIDPAAELIIRGTIIMGGMEFQRV